MKTIDQTTTWSTKNKPGKKNIYPALFLCIFILLIKALPVYSQKPLVLNSKKNHYSLGKHLYYLKDPTHLLTLKDITAPHYSKKFTKSTDDILYFGLTKSSYWVKIKLTDYSDPGTKWLLELAYQFYYYIDIYIVQPDGKIIQKKSGDYLSADKREIHHRNYVFKLPTIKNKTSTLYVRIRSKLMVFPLSIHTQSDFLGKIQKERLLLGLYYGIIVVMIIYNFFIFLSIRDRSYLYYVLYSISYLSWQFAYNGLGHLHLWPDTPGLRILNTILSPFVLFFILLFAKNFLESIKQYNLLNKISKLLIALCVIELIIIISTRVIVKILGIHINQVAGIIVTSFANLLNAGVIIFVMAAGIFSYIKGFKPARYFLFAWIFFSVGMVIFNLMMLNILPFNIITNNSIQVGSAFEIILFSFALADRINILKTEKEKAQDKYKSLIETIPYGILETSKNGKITFSNTALHKMLGLNAADVYKKPVWNIFIDSSVSAKLKAHIKKLVSKKTKPFSFSSQCLSSNNKVIDVLVDWIHKKDERNEINGLIAIITDITERRKVEEEKKTLRVHLKHVKRMEALGTLAGGIAHDFNNLLMTIIGNTSLVLIDIDEQHPHYEKLKSIEKAVESGSNLTRQFLVFAKGGTYQKEPGSINTIIQKTCSIISRTHKNVLFHEELDKNVYTVDIDQGQMEQVLLNIFVNACQAMPNGGDVFIKSENIYLDDNFVIPFSVKSGDYVKITVADTGIGIEQNIIEKIFDPFFTTKEMGRGTGLGLASTYGIITKHHGIINVKSKKGEGATFFIYLPKSPQAGLEPVKNQENLLTGAETILLVDDEEMIINIGRKFLEKLGYTVLTAPNGMSALEKYKKNNQNIQLVIIDMIMPDIGGEILFEKLKIINPDVKTLLSSGYIKDKKIEKLLQKGANGFIQKPFQIDTLSKALRQILDK